MALKDWNIQHVKSVVAAFRVVVSSGIVGQCAIVAVPHIDWIEWVVEPVRFKVGD